MALSKARQQGLQFLYSSHINGGGGPIFLRQSVEYIMDRNQSNLDHWQKG